MAIKVRVLSFEMRMSVVLRGLLAKSEEAMHEGLYAVHRYLWRCVKHVPEVVVWILPR